MTSLTGFDALLRGKHVVTYGQPFYAGWGLTEDRCLNGNAFSRRHRVLTLDQLLAGVLLRYPIYWDWDLNGYTSCEAVLQRLLQLRRAHEASGTLHTLQRGYLRRQARQVSAWLEAL
jgi:capsular polysaccharide export protein